MNKEIRDSLVAIVLSIWDEETDTIESKYQLGNYYLNDLIDDYDLTYETYGRVTPIEELKK